MSAHTMSPAVAARIAELVAEVETLRAALDGWEARDHDGEPPYSIERGAGDTLEIMVEGLTGEQSDAIEDWLAAARGGENGS